MDLNMLANDIVIADFQIGSFPFVSLVLGRITKYCAGVDFVILA